eukprot:TRINITY_DN21328_c0_g1_i1.p1 TRINITY_DN21328_c0_g1~~TRINITY_DN21328_c0_g1_i1.p1  ORF type:complete len:1017 (-),score=242.52 TRINITY_DN21328_c0_g1_i1:27-3077(-)
MNYPGGPYGHHLVPQPVRYPAVPAAGAPQVAGTAAAARGGAAPLAGAAGAGPVQQRWALAAANAVQAAAALPPASAGHLSVVGLQGLPDLSLQDRPPAVPATVAAGSGSATVAAAPAAAFSGRAVAGTAEANSAAALAAAAAAVTDVPAQPVTSAPRENGGSATAVGVATNGHSAGAEPAWSFEEGDSVEVWSEGCLGWYPGRVLSKSSRGAFLVRYGPLPRAPELREKWIRQGEAQVLRAPLLPSAAAPAPAAPPATNGASANGCGHAGEAKPALANEQKRQAASSTETVHAWEAPALLAQPPSLGAAVEIWSDGCRGWFAGEVVQVADNGAVQVRYGGLPTPPTTRQKWLQQSELSSNLRPGGKVGDSKYRVGDDVDVWFPACNDWIAGRIAEIAVDGDLRIACELREIWVKSGHVATTVRERREDVVAASESSVLSVLRQGFHALDKEGTGTITVNELARSWAKAAEARSKAPLTASERQLIAAAVQRRFEYCDMDGDGVITVVEWVHHVLLDKRPPGSACRDAMTKRVAKVGLAALSKIVQHWEQVCSRGEATVSCRDALARASVGVPGGDAEGVATLRELCAEEQHTSGTISYAQYCARRLGLTFAAVYLHYYDLSDGIAKYLSPILLWRRFKGIWHTGVCVFGSEYYYGGGVWEDPPGETPFGAPTKKKLLGLTLRSKREVDELCVHKLEREFNEDNYDILDHNCNNFSDTLVMFLLGWHIPDQVRKQPLQVKSSPVVRLLRPLLNRWLGRIEGGNRAGDHGKNAGLRQATRQTLAEAAKKGKGEIVLYDVPGGAMKSVVARVTKVHKDKTVDLHWFQRAGRAQQALRVPRTDVRQYVGGANGGDVTSTRKQVYFAALEALDEAEAQAARARAESNGSGTKRLQPRVTLTALADPASPEVADGVAVRRRMGRELEEAQRPSNGAVQFAPPLRAPTQAPGAERLGVRFASDDPHAGGARRGRTASEEQPAEMIEQEAGRGLLAMALEEEKLVRRADPKLVAASNGASRRAG